MSPSATSPRFIIHNPPLPSSRTDASHAQGHPDLSSLSPSRPFTLHPPGQHHSHHSHHPSSSSNPRDNPLSPSSTMPHLDIPPSASGQGRQSSRSYGGGGREGDREAADRERQRLQDIDSAKSMSRARSNSIASPEDALPPMLKRSLHSHGRYSKTSPIDESSPAFPALSEREEAEMDHARRGSFIEDDELGLEGDSGYPGQGGSTGGGGGGDGSGKGGAGGSEVGSEADEDEAMARSVAVGRMRRERERARERERERDRDRERDRERQRERDREDMEEEEEEMRMAMERRLSHERHMEETDSIDHRTEAGGHGGDHHRSDAGGGGGGGGGGRGNNGRSSPVRTMMASHLMGGLGTARNHFDFSSMDDYAEKEKTHLRESYAGGYHHAAFGRNASTGQWDGFEDDEAAQVGSGSVEDSRLVINHARETGEGNLGDTVPEADLLGSANGSLQSNGRMIGGTTVGDADSVRINSPPSRPQELPTVGESGEGEASSAGPFVRRRQRKSSQSNAHAGARRQGRLALFEGLGGALMGDGNGRDGTFSVNMAPDDQGPPRGLSSALPTKAARAPNKNTVFGTPGTVNGGGPPDYSKSTGGYMDYPDRTRGGAGEERPYRFSFYSNALPATIHARSLSELPTDGQTFEDLFTGRTGTSHEEKQRRDHRNSGSSETGMGGFKSGSTSPQTSNLGELSGGVGPNPKLSLLAKATAKAGMGPGGSPPLKGQPESDDTEARTWWLDVLSPTDEEMRMLAKVFGIHPLTTEDILLEETREKIELFRNYYLVCFRSFDQDPYSQTYLEPLNMYIIVFREGTLSFHFRGTPHPQNVRRRIKSLKDYISVTSDWISYALIDDITDAFGPLIQSIEYEVDGIDELVLILKEAEQSDMLRRIGTCRKKVMGLLRLMGNKADVVKGLAKRCNENWSVAPKSDIGLYLSDIQDHLITMTQNLNHYEKILSRSHSNYLAQISIEMTDANNQINDVLSKLTALGTVLIPMNLVTGLWGMNVHVPGQDIDSGYAWFGGILGALTLFAIVGAWVTLRIFVRN